MVTSSRPTDLESGTGPERPSARTLPVLLAVDDTVNLAARLEGQAPAGGVALGPATLARLEGAVMESLGAITVKGKEAPVEVDRLVALEGGSGASTSPRATTNEEHRLEHDRI